MFNKKLIATAFLIAIATTIFTQVNATNISPAQKTRLINALGGFEGPNSMRGPWDSPSTNLLADLINGIDLNPDIMPVEAYIGRDIEERMILDWNTGAIIRLDREILIAPSLLNLIRDGSDDVIDEQQNQDALFQTQDRKNDFWTLIHELKTEEDNAQAGAIAPMPAAA